MKKKFLGIIKIGVILLGALITLFLIYSVIFNHSKYSLVGIYNFSHSKTYKQSDTINLKDYSFKIENIKINPYSYKELSLEDCSSQAGKEYKYINYYETCKKNNAINDSINASEKEKEKIWNNVEITLKLKNASNNILPVNNEWFRLRGSTGENKEDWGSREYTSDPVMPNNYKKIIFKGMVRKTEPFYLSVKIEGSAEQLFEIKK